MSARRRIRRCEICGLKLWGYTKEAMPVTIPDAVLAAAHISESELKQELALTLFRQERLTLGQASRLAEMTQLAFQALLADRQIPIHYGVEEFREDVRTSRPPERF
jgi:predicted HTH domain antitoxin